MTDMIQTLAALSSLTDDGAAGLGVLADSGSSRRDLLEFEIRHQCPRIVAHGVLWDHDVPTSPAPSNFGADLIVRNG
jgi:hypothetical protein